MHARFVIAPDIAHAFWQGLREQVGTISHLLTSEIARHTPLSRLISLLLPSTSMLACVR